MSRYHTPAEITDSKDYKEPSKKKGTVGEKKQEAMTTETQRLTSSRSEVTGAPASLDRNTMNTIEYVPAEYFRGVQAAQLIQSGERVEIANRVGT